MLLKTQRHPRAATLAVLAAFVAAVLYPATAWAAPTPSHSTQTARATFGVRPATNGKPDKRTTLTYGMTAGAQQADQVAVVNESLATYTLQVYATDAINDANGQLTLLAPDQKPSDAGSWIKIGGIGASGRVTVRPRSYVVLPIQVSVPQNATPGDHVAGVVSQLVAVSRGEKVNVRLNQRVGLRVFIRVAGAVNAALAIEKLSVKYHDNWNPIGSGWATVSYRVHNNGNVSLGAGQTVRVSGLFGEVASVHPKTIPLILPGASFAQTVRLHGVFPEFRMTARVELRPIVPLGNLDTGLKSAYSASTGFWAVPWVLLAIIVGLIVLGAFGWRWRRKRRASAGRHSVPRNGTTRPRAEVTA
jgi:hypothetical protein